MSEFILIYLVHFFGIWIFLLFFMYGFEFLLAPKDLRLSLKQNLFASGSVMLLISPIITWPTMIMFGALYK